MYIFKKVNFLKGFIHSKLHLYIKTVFELSTRINSANEKKRPCVSAMLFDKRTSNNFINLLQILNIKYFLNLNLLLIGTSMQSDWLWQLVRRTGRRYCRWQ